MRVVAVLLCLFVLAGSVVAEPVFGERFDVGSNAFGPAPGKRSGLRAAASASGYLAAWLDERWGAGDVRLVLARLDRNGRTIDREALIPDPTIRPRGAALVASDGVDFLAVLPTSTAENPAAERLASLRVSSDNISAYRFFDLEGQAQGLGWNGEHYVLVIRSAERFSAILLDRSGGPASGVLHLPAGKPSMACGDEGCFAVVAKPWRVVVGGMLRSSQFPPLGKPARVVDLPYLHEKNDGGQCLVGVSTSGFYTVTTYLGSRRQLIVRRFENGDVSQMRSQYSVSFPVGTAVGSLNFTAADGNAIYVHTANGFWRVSSDGARQIIAQDQFVVAAAGSLVFRTYQSQFHAAPFESTTLGEDTLVSSAKAREVMPVVTRGTNSLLAAWVESRASDLERTTPDGWNAESLWIGMLDREGRPITEPVVVARGASITDIRVAFDGVNFLLVWKDDGGDSLFARRLISQSGLPLTDARAFGYSSSELSTSLIWTGSSYLFSGGREIAEFGPDGQLLFPRCCGGGGPFVGGKPANELAIAWDESRQHFVGLALDQWRSPIPNPIGGPYSATYAAVEVSGDLRSPRFGEVGWTIDWGWGTSFEPPAVAAGDGHSLALVVVPEGLRVYDTATWTRFPYAMTGESRLEASWNGREFLLAGSRTMARVSPGRVITHEYDLGANVRRSTFAFDGSHAAVVLVQTDGIESFRIDWNE